MAEAALLGIGDLERALRAMAAFIPRLAAKSTPR
jgi:hypothetical protein